MAGPSRLKFVASTSALTSSGSPKLESKNLSKIIATHDGHFHWDECLAVWLIKQLPDYMSARILRTRDPEELALADIVVDVGDVYDCETLRFDHHMKDFNKTFSEEHADVRLSSAGLIYLHYGREILKQLFPRLDGSTELEFLYKYSYSNYVRIVDAVDNGIESYYNADGTTPICRWQDPTTMSAKINRTHQIAGDDGFAIAYKMAGQDFMEWIQSVVLTYLPARKELIKAIENARGLHPSGRIIEFQEPGPYVSLIHSVEYSLGLSEDGPKGNNILFIIYPDEYKTGYRIRTVPIQQGLFTFRLGLPEQWRGVRGAALQEISGFSDLLFVHATGFLGGAANRDTALAVAAYLTEAFMEGYNSNSESK